MDKPAQVVSSQVVYEGRIFDVAVEQVVLPHREAASQVDVVQHHGSVVIAAMPTPDTVLLVRQYRHPAGEFLWELPAGSIDPGEDPDTAALREAHEELGVIVGRLQRLAQLWPLPGYCTERMSLYLATEIRQPRADEIAHQDEDESIEVASFTVEQVRRMAIDGAITDAKTVAALVFLESAGTRRA
jgi:ADP-ribose pyrophosphatase